MTNSHVTSAYARACIRTTFVASPSRVDFSKLWLVPSYRKKFFFGSIQTATVWKCLKRKLWLDPMNELATMAEIFEEFAQQQIKGCSGLSSLKTYATLLLNITLLRRLLDHFRHCIQREKVADILPNCDLSESSLASHTFSDRVPATRNDRRCRTERVWSARLKPAGETIRDFIIMVLYCKRKHN